MSRKPTPTTVSITPESLAQTYRATSGMAEVTAEHDAVQDNVMMLAQQLGYDGSLSVGALEDEIRFYQRRSVEAILALGTRLLLLKEMTPHGEFLKRVELLGFAERTARRFMQAAFKTSKTAAAAVLANQMDHSGKFLELVTMDDEDLVELAEGGTVAGLTLDDVSRMSVSELRAVLREAKANEQATGRLLAEKNSKIDELATQLNKATLVVPAWDEQLLKVADELHEMGLHGDEVFGRHVAYLDVCEVVADQLEPGAPDYRDKLEQVRVPIGRLYDQIERFAAIVARLQAEFETRLSLYQDRSHLLRAE